MKCLQTGRVEKLIPEGGKETTEKFEGVVRKDLSNGALNWKIGHQNLLDLCTIHPYVQEGLYACISVTNVFCIKISTAFSRRQSEHTD